MSEMLSEFPPIEWEEGYPTDASLEAFGAVKDFPIDWSVAGRFLRQELAKCAEHCCASYEEEAATDLLGKPCTHLHFSTGGWSGAESLISALLGKFWIEHLHIQWNRGGHYIFEVPA